MQYPYNNKGNESVRIRAFKVVAFHGTTRVSSSGNIRIEWTIYWRTITNTARLLLLAPSQILFL